MIKKYIINYHKDFIGISEREFSSNVIYDLNKIYSSKKSRGRYEVYFYAYPEGHFQEKLDKALTMLYKQIYVDCETITQLLSEFTSASNQLKQQIVKGKL